MPKVITLWLATATSLALLSTVFPASAYTGQDLAKHAKVSIAQAREIALKAHPGKITTRNWKRKKAAAAYDIPSTSSTVR